MHLVLGLVFLLVGVRVGIVGLMGWLPLPRISLGRGVSLRTSRICRNERTWRTGHRAAAPWMFAAAGVLVVGALAMAIMQHDPRDAMFGVVFVTPIVTTPTLFLAGLWQATAAVKRMPMDHARGPDVSLRPYIDPRAERLR
jgi:hypothetical protein